MEAAVAATVAEFGGIDILVANAGVLWLGPVESTPLKRWQLCLDVNLTGVFLVTKAVIPHVRARGGGSLIAVTTTGVGMTDAGSNAYWVSKAAAERLYLGLAADLSADNIAVNCLSPSRVVLTEGWQAGGAGHGDPAGDGRAARGDGPRRGAAGRPDAQAASPAPSSARKNSPEVSAKVRGCCSTRPESATLVHARAAANARQIASNGSPSSATDGRPSGPTGTSPTSVTRYSRRSCSVVRSDGARCTVERLSQNAMLPGSHLNRTVYSGRASSS